MSEPSAAEIIRTYRRSRLYVIVMVTLTPLLILADRFLW